MKFKFAPEAQTVIDSIAQLPDEALTDEVLKQPSDMIGGFDLYLKLNKGSDGKKIPSKEWAKLRRQLSFMYEFVRLADQIFSYSKSDSVIQAASQGQKFVKPTEDERKKEIYKVLVGFFKDMKSGKMLQHDTMVRIGLQYGVIYLSDQEIQGLIERNKV